MTDRKPPASSEVAGPSGLDKPLDGEPTNIFRLKTPEKIQEQLRMCLILPTREDIPSPGGSNATSPRRPVSPLLEVKRPICTLNCDNCSSALINRFGIIPSKPDTSKYNFI